MDIGQERESLAHRYRGRLGAAPRLHSPPFVSLVVLNRNGRRHLERLVSGLVQATDYPRMELVLVDNASTDGSVDLLHGSELPFPSVVIENERNVSFSDGCNQGAAAASGDRLLFINNDVEPFEAGWLTELVACAEGSGAAAVAATLLHGRDSAKRTGGGFSPAIQHRGVGLVREGAWLAPINLADGENPDLHIGADVRRAALTAACLLIRRDAYSAVGGFTTGFEYGWEDVDLALKLAVRGERLICSGRALALHDESSTRLVTAAGVDERSRAANRRLLMLRWGPRLYREYMLDRLEGRGYWSTKERPYAVLLAGFGSPEPVRLAEELTELGWRTDVLDSVAADVETAASEADCLIALPGALDGAPPQQATAIAWVTDAEAAGRGAPAVIGTDALVASDEATGNAVGRSTGRTAAILGRRPEDGRAAAGSIVEFLEERVARPRCCIASPGRATRPDVHALALRRAVEQSGHMCRYLHVAKDELPAGALLADVAIHLSTEWDPVPAQFNILLAPEPVAEEDDPKRSLYDVRLGPSDVASPGPSLGAALAEAGRTLRIEPVRQGA